MVTETNNTPAIEFRNVSLSFDEKRVLSDINFKLQRGEMIFTIVEAAVRKLRSALGDAFDVESRAILGSPKRVILDEAETWEPDLIVVGSHGYPSCHHLSPIFHIVKNVDGPISLKLARHQAGVRFHLGISSAIR